MCHKLTASALLTNEINDMVEIEPCIKKKL